ncbi:unnamed protein product [Ranitomeya imitator]|uniref:Uncharacterized protein n=1 Tax=Ranitomeya imitator TaxID=111125 RepID=A0ABN9LN85_9NEOB|nr:unnamed protein product [Ranitomeya imitator]
MTTGGSLTTEFTTLSKKYGDIFTVYEGTRPVIILCSYKALKETFIDKAEEFSGRAYYASFYDFTKGDGQISTPAQERGTKQAGRQHRMKMGGPRPGPVMLIRPDRPPDLAFSSGEKWKEFRRFSALTLGNFGVGKRSFEERIREEAMYLTEVLRKSNGSPIDLNYHTLRAVSNVICSVVFGSRFEYQDENFQKLVKCVQDNFEIMSSRWGIAKLTSECFNPQLSALARLVLRLAERTKFKVK